MRHFTDPILSRIQSSVESQLRRQATEVDQGNLNNALAQHPHMQDITQICEVLQAKRRNPLKRFVQYHKKVKLKKMDADCQCMEFYCRLILCHLYGDKKRYDALKEEFEFSGCDLKWFKVIEEYFVHFGPGSHHDHIPYVNYDSISDFVQAGLPNNLRVGILGDWGTGQDVAIEVLRRVVALQPDIIIHLGDVYYSGNAEEYDEKLHRLIDEFAVHKNGDPIPVLIMPGNHDMYAGGKSFYEAIRRLNNRQTSSGGLHIEQQASYFCLRLANQSWQLLSMDTAYHDHNPFMVDSGMTRVRDREEEWLLDKVRNFPGQTILLSHHQPFSPYEEIGSMVGKKPSDYYHNPHLMSTYTKICVEAGKEIPLWIWGHEHNLAIYQPFAGIDRGRCVGHSAVPVLCMHDPYRTRQPKILEFFESIFALFRGKWGHYIHRELAVLVRLLVAKKSVSTPLLVREGEAPVMLAKTEDENMYRNGFSMMVFNDRDGISDLVVDYYDDVEDSPLYTELISSQS